MSMNLHYSKIHLIVIVITSTGDIHYNESEILKSYIETYKNNGKICAICLQETWLELGSDLSLLKLPEYNLISVSKSCSAHGGVAIYLHKTFKFRTINLDTISEVWDGQIVEIFQDVPHMCSKKKIVICNIYRPPVQTNENITTFTSELTALLQKFRN